MERKLQFPGKKGVSRVRSSRRRPGCIRLFVCPTTGGRLEISVSPRETIPGLKAALARKLRVPPGRIALIYKEKVLNDGSLLDHNIPDESYVTLLPKMESGLSVHNTDKNIMQALENLTERQVNDFLGGRAPLMLAIRMGDHMVFVQLQLSTAVQNQGQSQQTGSTGMSPAAAHVLSQSGLSASALAQAGRCLSHRLHMRRLQGDHNSGQSISSNSVSQTSSSTNCPQNRLSVSHPAPATTSLPTSLSTSLPIIPECTTDHRQVSSHSISSISTVGAGPSQTFLQLPTSSTLPGVSNNPLPSPPPSPGAVIDSMKHEGKGVFTGTFSGTLDASLQDVNGSPKRNVNTILHILNDLLVAAPQSPTASPKSSHATPTIGSGSSAVPQAFTFTSNTSLPLTPPCSPLSKKFPAQFGPVENSDNEQLKSKMQRVQTMLAQRKEQRRIRREINGPYHVCKPLINTQALPKGTSTSLINFEEQIYQPSSAGASMCKTSNSTPSSQTESGESSCNYCMTCKDQDSLAV